MKNEIKSKVTLFFGNLKVSGESHPRSKVSGGNDN